jgi:hypothetical protein
MPTTDLDDLKIAWKELSQKLDRQNVLALHQDRENKLARFRSGLRPLVLGQNIQLVLGLLIAAVSTRFWSAHLHVPVLLVCGLLLQAYGIMCIAFAVRDLMLIHRLDYGAPVLVIQKQLVKLGAWHIRTGLWFGLTGSLVWLPAMLVLLSMLGGDFKFDNPHKLWWLIASALVCLGLNYGLLLLARSPGKCGRAVAASWIGRSVRRAQATLNEIEEFKHELG